MTATTIRVQMAQRKDTAANWTAANPILLSGEIGYETDTKKFKIGDGTTNWNSLAYLPIPDGSGNLTITGNLEIGSTGSLTFEGSTADGFETTLAVTNPTADRTITLPDRSGTVITSGDTGTVTSTMILDGTIVNGDVNASAAIAGTKITPDFGAQTITTTGVVSAAVGAAATPSITFTGDTNTGIYSPGADQVAISTGGSGRLFVDASGNVGLGITPVANTLLGGARGSSLPGLIELAGNGNTVGSSGFAIGQDGSGVATLFQRANAAMYFATNGTERLRITSAGLVGVGTSSPNFPVSIYGATNSYSQYINALSGTASSDGFLVGLDEAGSAVLRYRESGSLIFYTSDAERVRIDSSGRVGVGTTTPGYQLDLTADINARNYYFPNAGAVFFTQNSTNGIYVGGTGVNYTTFTTNSSERLRIDSSGRVGIGTSDPTSGTSSFYDDLVVRNATSGTGAGITIQSNSTNGFSGLNLRKADGTDVAKFVSESSSGKLYIETAGSAAITVDSAQRVGIGTTSPSNRLEVGGEASPQLAINSTTNGVPGVLFQGAGTTYGSITQNITTGQLAIKAGASGQNSYFITFGTNDGSERARIDSSGRLLVGTSSARTLPYLGVAPVLQVEGVSDTQIYASLTSSQADANAGPRFILGHQRSGTIGGNAVLLNGDNIGRLEFAGGDGTTLVPAANIGAFVDGTPGTNDMPGRLVFSTTPDSGSSPVERLRITNDGRTLIGTTNTSPVSANVAGTMINSNGEFQISRDNATPLLVNRKTSDGNLVEFWQDGANEGSISVSGTTVSYNGAHLSRWTQLPGGAERTEILRGTVLSNIDEMCEWGDEDNEQLNRMKVSDVEGDKNVSGVFQAWDDDDDTYTNDFYCAMTGDFIIRVSAGVTVERGDLLISAGDGTAKPQDDDIIRSKTIAKVTSTNVSCTYEDGSYCVPCVLMAC